MYAEGEGAAAVLPEEREILEKLNPRQREAVSYCDGPLLVLAGAGSGKTRVLAHKIAYLVASGRARPWDFLAVTFTNKAANEMKERVKGLLPGRGGDMQVSTFHSFGLRFLFRNRSLLPLAGLQEGFAVFDRNDCRSLVREIVENLGLDSKQFEAPSVLERISTVKNENRADSPLLEGVYGDIFAAYGKELRRQNAVDFDDLLLLPLEMLSRDEELRRRERDRLSWILVDEYQDVNRPQYLLLRRLVGEGNRIMVVGDPDQSIYGWRGADMGMILNFEKDFPSARVVVLDQNYRSSGNILGGANALIRGNSTRRKKDLWTARNMGEKIYAMYGRSEYEEADFLAGEIRRLHDREGYGYGDIAVLYRINAMSRVYEQKFLEGRLPYRVVRGTAFYERKEVKDVLSFLRAAVNPSDRVSLSRIANIPARGLGKKSLEKVQAVIDSSAGLPGGVLEPGGLRQVDPWQGGGGLQTACRPHDEDPAEVRGSQRRADLHTRRRRVRGGAAKGRPGGVGGAGGEHPRAEVDSPDRREPVGDAGGGGPLHRPRGGQLRGRGRGEPAHHARGEGAGVSGGLPGRHGGGGVPSLQVSRGPGEHGGGA